MAVNLSPVWGAGAQLFDNSGNVLSGGKIYTYAAGTTTPAVTYTSESGATANSNPIVLNSAGRVPNEIWLTLELRYKFVLKDSNDVLIGTWDNIEGVNSSFVAYTGQDEYQTATAGQTVFTLTQIEYQPDADNLIVFVDGVNQYGPDAQYAFVETDSTTVTFTNGLHLGARVRFSTAAMVSTNVVRAGGSDGQVQYNNNGSLDGLSYGTSGQVLTSQGNGLAPTWTAAATGTVTAVTGTSPIASSGGTTPAISITKADATTDGYLSSTDWNTFNNKQAAGTYVTSVSATSPVASTGGTTPTISMPQATGSVSGYLSSTDWTTFNNKGSGTVTSVTGTSPIASSGGATPAISIAQATTSASGYLSSTDWNTFNNKQAALVSGTNIKTINTQSILGSGNLTVTATAAGSQGQLQYNDTGSLGAVSSGVSGQVLTSQGTGAAPTWTNVSGTGDVVGPASATDNAITRFDSTTGKLIQNSTVTLDDSGNAAGVNAVTFDTTPTTPPSTEGSLYWDSADGNQTLSLVMAGGNAVQQIGQEQYYRIKASSAITNGQVVMFTGTVGASGGLTGAPATGLTAETASYVMGVATQDIAHNDWGYVTSFGLVRGIDTSAFAAGNILYLNPSVAGGLTTTIPSAPNPKVQVCAVVYADASVGSVFVRATFGGALGQYEGDVQVTTPADGNLLIRNQTAGKWVNASLTAGTGVSVTNGAGSVTIANTGVTSVTGTSPVTSSGGATPAISLASGYGDTQNPYASKTANYFLAAPNGSAGVPTFRAMVAADVPTLNQNTTGSAGSVANALTIGTGLSGTSYNGSSAVTVAIDSTVATLTGTQTLTNKTITGTKETVYTITDGAAFEIDPANGGIQTITLGASRTPAATNFTAGQSVTLMIDDGSAYTITWSTVNPTWVGGTAPTLATSGYTIIEFWKVGSTIYGAYVGAVA